MRTPGTAIQSANLAPGQLRALRRLVQRGSAKLVGRGGEAVELPASVRVLLAEIARNMEAGKAVSVVAENQELTTQRAANILGVSRPFLVRLLEEKQVPFRKVGSHRRVYLADLLAYKSKRDRVRHRAIKQLAMEDVDAGTYDTVILPEGCAGPVAQSWIEGPSSRRTGRERPGAGANS